MRAPSNKPSRDFRCRRCGSPLADIGLISYMRALWPWHRCSGCRSLTEASPHDVLVTPAEGQQDPFSLFMPEKALNRPEPERVADAAPTPKRMTVLAAAPARPLIVAFGLGLAGGAAPFLWHGAVRSELPSATRLTDAPAARQTAAPRGATTVLLPASTSSTVTRAADRSLPSSPAPSPELAAREAAAGSRASDLGRSTPARRTTAARRPIRTVRYPGRRSATFRGSVAVDTTPTGARVTLDGTTLGSSPIRIDGVPAGSHVLRLEADGRRVSASAIQVVANQTTRVARSLERTPSPPVVAR
jgi:hypothetical protein